MSVEYLTDIDRREWTEKDVLKKILFEDRKIVDLLKEILLEMKDCPARMIWHDKLEKRRDQ